MKISYSFFVSDLLLQTGTLLENIIRDKKFRKINHGDFFNELKHAGVDGVELGITNRTTLNDIHRIKQKLTQYNIRILSLHQPIRLLSQSKLPEIRKVFHYAKKLDASLITFHSDMAGKQLLDDSYINTIKSLEKRYGIYACFENMQRHHIFWRNRLYWHRETFQKVMMKNKLHITLDTSHMAQTNEDIVSFFKENKTRIKNIHISDYKPHAFSSSLLGTYKIHMPLGKGSLPIKKFLKTLKEENYKGNITMEIHGNLQELCRSAHIIKNYIS